MGRRPRVSIDVQLSDAREGLPVFEGRSLGKYDSLPLRNVSGVSFKGAKLNGVSFCGSDLRNCDFSGCVINGCDFDRADLRGAVFDGFEGSQRAVYKVRIRYYLISLFVK